MGLPRRPGLPRDLARADDHVHVLPVSEEVQLSAASNALPIHIFHGTQGPVVPETLGHTANQILQSMGFTPGYTSYPMQHEVCGNQIADIAKTLKA